MEGPKGSHGGRNILIALDYTDESVRTVKWALGQHVRAGDSVTLLHVQPEHAPAAHVLPGPGPFAALWEREQEQRHLRQTQEQSVASGIHAWAQHYCPQGVSIAYETAQVAPSAVAVAGDGGAARDCIVSEAGRRKADCLILGSHRVASEGGQLGWRSLTLGAAVPTSEYCAQHAPCPVIVVPPMPAPALPVPDKSCAVMAAAGTAAASSAFLDSLAL